MRDEDLQRLAVPYPRDGRSADDHFHEKLGVTVQASISLAQMIFDDLDVSVGGVGWWSPHPGKKRRILVADYLFQAAQSIATNLVEAKLHLLEALGAW